MLSYALRRLLLLVPVFLAVSAIIFLIIHLVPGDPVDNLARIGSSPEQKLEIAARYGLDKPIVEQYLIWLQRLAHGDLGNAIVLRQPVSKLIARNLPYSLALGGCALLFSTFFGILAGVVAAIRKETRVDQGVMAGILVGSTLPSFWLGLLLILIFAVELGWFPVSGARVTRGGFRSRV